VDGGRSKGVGVHGEAGQLSLVETLTYTNQTSLLTCF
jgi:hypothetical protein